MTPKPKLFKFLNRQFESMKTENETINFHFSEINNKLLFIKEKSVVGLLVGALMDFRSIKWGLRSSLSPWSHCVALLGRKTRYLNLTETKIVSICTFLTSTFTGRHLCPVKSSSFLAA